MIDINLVAHEVLTHLRADRPGVDWIVRGREFFAPEGAPVLMYYGISAEVKAIGDKPRWRNAVRVPEGGTSREAADLLMAFFDQVCSYDTQRAAH